MNPISRTIKHCFKLTALKLTMLVMFFPGAVLQVAQASAVKIGNGDDGTDLEGATPIRSGPIYDARQAALAHLRSLNVPGIPGLGMLLAEVEGTQLFMTERNINTDFQEVSPFEADMNGHIYAKTFPEAHAETRFFPVAKQLGSKELVALHIHEALHRSLPKSVREDEKVVTKVTLAITAPGATHDRIRKAVAKAIPAHALDEMVATETAGILGAGKSAYPLPGPNSKILRPTTIGYQALTFVDKETFSSDQQLRFIHSLTSHLYPFGGDYQALGIGLQFSLVDLDGRYTLGPVDVSGRMKLWTIRGFDVDGFAELGLNPLSAQEMASRIPGRDTLTFGLAAKQDLRYFYVENYLAYTVAGDAKQPIGRIEYTHNFGGIYSLGVRSGFRYRAASAGLLAEVYLADSYRVQGGAFFQDDIGRFRIVSLGPEVSWETEYFDVRAFGKVIVDSSDGMDLDYLGNLMNAGLGRGMVGISLNVQM